MTINELYFHIKGTPREDEAPKATTNNYVYAAVGYDKGKGYYWLIHRCGKFKIDGCTLISFEASEKCIREYLVPCTRASEARKNKATELFCSNVVSAITHRLGYDIEL